MATGLARANRRHGDADRFESEAVHFFERVRGVYLELAAAEPGRVHRINADRPLAGVQAEVLALLKELSLC